MSEKNNISQKNAQPGYWSMLLPAQQQSLKFPPILPSISLAQMYVNLGQCLLREGLELRRKGDLEKAKYRFAQAAQAFLDAKGESGSLEDDPGESAVLQLYLAQTRQVQERALEAIQAYIQAVILQPELAQQALSKAHDLLNRELAPSLEDLEAELRHRVSAAEFSDETATTIYNFLGRLNLYQDQYADAITHFNEALAHKPSSIFVHEGLSEALWPKDKEKALETIQEAIDLADQKPEAGRMAATRLQKARYLVELGRFLQAIEIADAGLLLGQDKALDFQTLLSRCYLEQDNLSEAEMSASLVLSQTDQAAKYLKLEARTVLAEVYYRRGEYNKAIQEASQVLELDPSYLPAVRIKGMAHIVGPEGEIDLGVRMVRYVVEKTGSDLYTLITLIQGLFHLRRSTEEITPVFKRALNKATGETKPELLIELAEFAQRLDLPEEILVLLDRISDSNMGTRNPRWWLLRGNALNKLNRLEDALAAYRHLAKLDPGNLEGLKHTAEVLEKQNLNQEAIEIWQQIAQSAPQKIVAQMNTARLLLRANRDDEAIQTLEELLDADVNNEQEMEIIQLKIQALRKRDESVSEFLMKRARQLSSDNGYCQALVSYELAHRESPDDFSVYWDWIEALRMASYEVGDQELSRQKIQQAMSLWEEAMTKVKPEDIPGWILDTRAMLNLKSDHLTAPGLRWQGIVYLQRGLFKEPETAFRWAAMSSYYREIGVDASTLAASARAVKLGPEVNFAQQERAAILADTGDFKKAKKAIQLSLKIDPENEWSKGIMAYILMHLGEYERALKYANLESENLWDLALYASIYFLKGDVEKTAAIREQILEKVRDKKDTSDCAEYANALVDYGMVRNDPALIDQAIEILEGDKVEKSLTVCINLATSYLYRKKISEANEWLLKVFEKAKNLREVDDFINFDLYLLNKYAPVSSEADWQKGLKEIIQRAKDARTRILDHPITIEDELNNILEKLPRTENLTPDEDGDYWVKLGAQASLARYYLKNRQWKKAREAYRNLGEYRHDFPEFFSGMKQALEALQASGDKKVKENSPTRALKDYQVALKFLNDSQIKDAYLEAGLKSRVGICLILLKKLESREGIVAALEACKEIERVDYKFGSIAAHLISNSDQFWQIRKTLEGCKKQNEHLKKDAETALEGLEEFLDQFINPRERDYDRMPVTPPITVEIGSQLIPSDSNNWIIFKKFLPEMRERIKSQRGIPMPGVRVRRNEADWSSDQYKFRINEVPLVTGNVKVGHLFCPVDIQDLVNLGISAEEIDQCFEPFRGYWVGAGYKELLMQAQLEFWDHEEFYIHHLESLLIRHLGIFLGYQEVSNLLAEFVKDETNSSIMKEFLNNDLDKLMLVRILRELLAEDVSITPLREILLTLKENGIPSVEIAQAVVKIRARLKKYLPGNRMGELRVKLPPQLERKVSHRIRSQDQKQFLASLAEETQDWLREIRTILGDDQNNKVVVVRDADSRMFMQRLIESEFPTVRVIAESEILSVDGLVK